MELISRKEALKVFGDVHPLDHNTNAYKSRIEKLPIIESRLLSTYGMTAVESRPKGEWEEYDGYNPRVERALRRCSYCKRFKIHVVSVDKFNFCPHCGADMRMEEENDLY